LRRSWATSSQRTEGTRIASTQAYPVAGVKVRGGRPAPPSVAGLTFTGWQQPIACGGVAVFPNDVIVIDDDGAVLIPAALLDEMLVLGPEQEREEAWIMEEVKRGAALPGLYPMNAQTRARYVAEHKSGGLR
jgi:regulator of RNase E activity RraA